MQGNKSARDKMLRKLQKLGMNYGSVAFNATKGQQLESKSVGLEKINDNELARFVVTLMQYQR